MQLIGFVFAVFDCGARLLHPVVLSWRYRQNDRSLRSLPAEPSMQLIGFVFAFLTATRVSSFWSFSCGVIVAKAAPIPPIDTSGTLDAIDWLRFRCI